MKAMVLNEQEMEGLVGMTHLQFRLYVLLRWAMDAKTRLVGSRSHMSYGWMAREMEVPAVRGRHSSDVGKPTSKAIRSALDQLEKCGLVQSRGNGEVLVFLLPLASAALARSNDEGQVRGRGQGQVRGRGESPANTDDSDLAKADEGQWVSADEGQQLRYQVNPSLSVRKAAAALPAVDCARDDMLLQGQMVEWLKDQEKRRGKLMKLAAEDAVVAGWVGMGASMETIRQAYALAVADRVAHGNPHPVNASFLSIFVGRVMAPPPQASRKKQEAPQPWFMTASGIEAKGRELGIVQQRGEAFGLFRNRIYRESGLDPEEFQRVMRDAGQPLNEPMRWWVVA